MPDECAEHPLDRQMRLAGVGRAQNSDKPRDVAPRWRAIHVPSMWTMAARPASLRRLFKCAFRRGLPHFSLTGSRRRRSCPCAPRRQFRPNSRYERFGGNHMYHGQVEGTDLVVLDKRFGQLFAGYMRVDPPLDRLGLGRGSGLVRGRALSDLVGHSQQPDAALRRGIGRRSPSSVRPRTIRTATPSTTRAGSSPAST